jgi:hypothetical protein
MRQAYFINLLAWQRNSFDVNGVEDQTGFFGARAGSSMKNRATVYIHLPNRLVSSSSININHKNFHYFVNVAKAKSNLI